MLRGIAPRTLASLLLVWAMRPGASEAGSRTELASRLSLDPLSALSSGHDEGGVALKYRLIVGLSLFAGAMVTAALPTQIRHTPPSCRWCGGADPNAVDRWANKAKWDRPCRAGRLSYWTLGVASITALGPMSYEKSHREWLVNAGAIVDSVAATVMLTQAAKYAVRRERPAASPCLTPQDKETDRNLSFFSGHTALAFAAVAAARETARLRGHTNRDWLLVSGASAALTGYLRIAGNRHHLTDVVAGAAVGIAIGT